MRTGKRTGSPFFGPASSPVLLNPKDFDKECFVKRLICFAILALAIAACSSNSAPPKQLQPTGLRIVAGDNQVAQVATGVSTGGSVGVATTPVPGVDVLPDTLVTQVVGDTVLALMGPITGPSFSMEPRDPSGIEIPAGTSVSYDVDLDGRGACQRRMKI